MRENWYIYIRSWGDKQGFDKTRIWAAAVLCLAAGKIIHTHVYIVLNPIPHVIRFFSPDFRYFCSNGRRLCDSLPAALGNTPTRFVFAVRLWIFTFSHHNIVRIKRWRWRRPERSVKSKKLMLVKRNNDINCENYMDSKLFKKCKLMSGTPKNNILKKLLRFKLIYSEKNWYFNKNKLLDLDKCLYHQICSYSPPCNFNEE